MSSEYLGLRLNQKKHQDIIKWLNRFDDRSEEARRLMALGIKVSSGEHHIRMQSPEPLVWTFPGKDAPIAKSEPKPKKKDFMTNILSSFD